MFQTEIILFLQSFASEFLTSFFNFISDITYHAWTMPLMLLILFGVSFRLGFILVHVVLWNGLITGYLKNYFGLPRPCGVDSAVSRLDKGIPNPTPFKSMGAKSFFGGLPQEPIEYFRTHQIDTFGFPSGHTSRAMASWGSLFMFFKKTWVRIISVVFIILVPLSRMYLGRHFLVDVLSGYLVGFAVVLVFYTFVFRKNKLKAYVFEKLGKIRFDLKSIFFLTYFLVIPFFLPFLPNTNLRYSASLLGVNLGFMLLWMRGIPNDEGHLFQRIARVFIAGVFYFGVSTALEKGAGLLFGGVPIAVEFVRQTLAFFLVIWGSTEVSIKLGFFKR